MEHYTDDEELNLMDSADSGVSAGGGSGRGYVAGGGRVDALGVRGGPMPARATAHAAAARLPAGSFRTYVVSAGLAEFFGSFFLVYLGLCAVYASNMIGDDALQTGSMLMISLCYGFTYGCVVYAFSINGGGYMPSIRQLNPALSVSLYLLGRVDLVKTVVTILAQILGAVIGCAMIFGCFSAHSLRTFELFDSANVAQQVFLSAFVSFLFLFVLIITNFALLSPVLQQPVMQDSSEQAPQTVHELNSLISALAATVGSMLTAPFSGCFLNPLFGLTLLALTGWRNSVLPVIFGPLIGALLAALVAKLFAYRTRAPFLASVKWGQGGLGGLGLSTAGTGSTQMHAYAPVSQHLPASAAANGRHNPFAPNGAETSQGSRF